MFAMEQQWQIVEISDVVKTFVELSVSVVPEFWIFQADAMKKIKSRACPIANEGWTTYKCRILMKGGNVLFSRVSVEHTFEVRTRSQKNLKRMKKPERLRKYVRMSR